MFKDKLAVYEDYSYIPMVAPNAVGLALASILLIAQFSFGLYYRQWWLFTTWIVGLSLTVVGWVLRLLSGLDYYNEQWWKCQYAFFIVVPALIMAGVYYQMSKLLTIWGLKFASFKPMFYAGIFTACDVVSIILQAIGGGMAAGGVYGAGRDIILAGIAAQLVSMAVFFILFTRLVYKVSKSTEEDLEPRYAHIRRRPLFKAIVPAIYACWIFVYTRGIYRIVELSEGWNGFLSQHEVYFLVLEGLMMILAMSCLTVIYPGMCYSREVIPVVGLHIEKGQKGINDDFGSASTEKDEYVDF